MSVGLSQSCQGAGGSACGFVAARAAVVVAATRPDADRCGLVAYTTATLGGLDTLVNNAGDSIHRPAFEVPDDAWDTVVGLNLRALGKISTIAARHMVDHGGGTITNFGYISSITVKRPQWQPAGNASKARRPARVPTAWHRRRRGEAICPTRGD